MNNNDSKKVSSLLLEYAESKDIDWELLTRLCFSYMQESQIADMAKTNIVLLLKNMKKNSDFTLYNML